MALYRWQRTIVDGEGNTLSGASVEFRDEDTGSLVQLYTDRAGTISAGNPITADSNGYAFAYLEPARLKITATSGSSTASWRDVFLPLDKRVRYFDSLADLEAFTGNDSEGAAYLRGRTAAGDGGEGEFRWDGSDLSSTLVLASVTSTSVDDTTDTITSAGHGLIDGNGVVTTTAVNGLTANQVYWVVGATTDTFQLSATFGGAAVDLTGTTNFTVEHLLDPLKGVYVTASDDPTGLNGAWARQSDSRNVFDFGASLSSITQGATNLLRYLKSTGGGVFHLEQNQDISQDGSVEIVGQFDRGITFDGGKSTLNSPINVDSFVVTNEVGDIAESYFNKVTVNDLEISGAGKATVGVGHGFVQRAAADVATYNLRAINSDYGIWLDGGLISSYYNTASRENNVGVRADFFDDGAGGLNSFGPNNNSFFGGQIQKNDVAIQYTYNPAGAINWIGLDIEANNESGTAADGVKVVELTSAGHQNFYGCHFESNAGQYGIWYDGFNKDKNLNMIGCEVIHGTDTVLHMEQGLLTSIGSRITNGAATNDIFLNTGTSATLIDTEAQVSGDTSQVIGIKFGRISFGGNPVDVDPLLSFTPDAISGVSGNIATQFSNDQVVHYWRSTSGTLTAQTTVNASGDWVFSKAGANGISFATNAATKFIIGRSGGNSLEPGSDNTISLGSGALRYSEVFAATGTINTSDEREKQDQRSLTEAESLCASDVKKALKAFKWAESVKEKGDSARWHFGVMAQEVERIFSNHGLNANDYGLFCYDEWDEIVDDDGKVIQEAGNRYGIRYEELFAFILAAM